VLSNSHRSQLQPSTIIQFFIYTIIIIILGAVITCVKILSASGSCTRWILNCGVKTDNAGREHFLRRSKEMKCVSRSVPSRSTCWYTAHTVPLRNSINSSTRRQLLPHAIDHLCVVLTLLQNTRLQKVWNPDLGGQRSSEPAWSNMRTALISSYSTASLFMQTLLPRVIT